MTTTINIDVKIDLFLNINLTLERLSTRMIYDGDNYKGLRLVV